MTNYNFAQLRRLWQDAGGGSATSSLAAAVALAESEGNPAALGAADDRGLWQIVPAAHPKYDPVRLFDPAYNAMAAVEISGKGASWRQWCTAYTDGACGSKGGRYDPYGASPAGKKYQENIGTAAAAESDLPNYRRTVTGSGKTSTDPADTEVHLTLAWHHLAHALATTVPTQVQRARNAKNLFVRAVTRG